MSGFVGALVEAWDELRLHKLRVLLALIGVAVAVAAITAVTAAVQMLTQGFQEQSERDMGRQVTLTLSAWAQTEQAAPLDELDATYLRALDRYGITWATRDWYLRVPFRFPDGTRPTEVRAVDPDLGTMQRVQVDEGRWFTEADRDTFAPLLVVNEAFLGALGADGLETRPTVLLGDREPVRARVIGVVPDRWPDEMPQAMVLYDQLTRWYAPESGGGQQAPELKVWVPPESADDLGPRLRRDVAAVLPGWQVEVWDNRSTGSGLDGAARWVALGVGGFALLLGGLGLVNIALVTVRYRIREIGIRRSFGATSGRIFFGVLMESVVATVVAGLVGVVLAVAIVKNIPVDVLFGTLQDRPPFPVSAALVGMACATGVGALAGLIPATVAVRVKVIDAIRY
ncbi:ABC transporter permease [Cellulomonas wangsupingiae]|uniref:ABC transporter permease n=1 Tax=Cellulomonas wangsupingiae TaxID=2968085 RepID=A0ABY5K2M8_9CELL|nr:ABC transporter permease [Cellulomonas wangsupingiae]MCC2335817.1 ABC transporter permease [Cellulomonas wangsupingiae]MCM0639894.1 ABC transporter permease [Cellulomonas wangsupingiae]UUI64044.1 ABC transporter permease [Cellulomonas wangsupingiae]